MAEITTEAQWLACVEPRDLTRFASGRRVNPDRFHHLLMRWGERVRGLLNARQVAALAVYSAWVSGGRVGECPWPPENDDFDFTPLYHWTDPAVNASWFATELRRSQWLTALARVASAAAEHFPHPPAAPLDPTKAHKRKSKKGREEQGAAEEDARERWRRDREAHRERTLWQFANEFRDVTGNLFRPAAFDPTWRTEAVVGLAAGIDESEAYERLPILADALEEAGCTDPQVLSHARDAGTHVRGCWLIDRILGRWE